MKKLKSIDIIQFIVYHVTVDNILWSYEYVFDHPHENKESHYGRDLSSNSAKKR